MHYLSPAALPARQSGAALVIGLVLLLTLTLLGISSLNGATAEIRMADGVKQTRAAFEASESALNGDLARRAPLTFVGDEVLGDQINTDAAGDRPVFSYTAYNADTRAAVATATVTNHFRRANVFGTGTELGVGTATSMQVHFFSRSQGTAQRGARSDQEIGFFVQAP